MNYQEIFNKKISIFCCYTATMRFINYYDNYYANTYNSFVERFLEKDYYGSFNFDMEFLGGKVPLDHEFMFNWLKIVNEVLDEERVSEQSYLKSKTSIGDITILEGYLAMTYFIKSYRENQDPEHINQLVDFAKIFFTKGYHAENDEYVDLWLKSANKVLNENKDLDIDFKWFPLMYEDLFNMKISFLEGYVAMNKVAEYYLNATNDNDIISVVGGGIEYSIDGNFPIELMFMGYWMDNVKIILEKKLVNKSKLTKNDKLNQYMTPLEGYIAMTKYLEKYYDLNLSKTITGFLKFNKISEDYMGENIEMWLNSIIEAQIFVKEKKPKVYDSFIDGYSQYCLPEYLNTEINITENQKSISKKIKTFLEKIKSFFKKD